MTFNSVLEVSDICTNRIYPWLERKDLRNTSLVSTKCCAIVQEYAGNVPPYSNATLTGTHAVTFKLDGTISALFRNMFITEILTPELSKALTSFCAFREQSGFVKNSEPLAVFNFLPYGATEAMGQNIDPKMRNEMGLILLLFSLEQPISASQIGQVLNNCLSFSFKETQTFLIKVVFSHRDSVNISLLGNEGLGKALRDAVCSSEGEGNGTVALPLLCAHPRAKDIPGEGQNGVGDMLRSAIYRTKREDLKLILDLPHAKDIPANDGEYGLGACLFSAAKNKKDTTEFVEAIFSYPHAGEIQAEGLYGLGSALIAAIINGKKHLVNKILSHTNAKHIPFEGPYSLRKAEEEALKLNTKSGILELISSFLEKRVS